MKINFITPLSLTEYRHVRVWIIATMGLLCALMLPALVYTGIQIYSLNALKKQYASLKQQTASFETVMNEKNSYAKQARTTNANADQHAKNKAMLTKISEQLHFLNLLNAKGIQIQSALLSTDKNELACIVPTAEYSLNLLAAVNKEKLFGVLEITSITKSGQQFQVTMRQQEAAPAENKSMPQPEQVKKQ